MDFKVLTSVSRPCACELDVTASFKYWSNNETHHFRQLGDVGIGVLTECEPNVGSSATHVGSNGTVEESKEYSVRAIAT